MNRKQCIEYIPQLLRISTHSSWCPATQFDERFISASAYSRGLGIQKPFYHKTEPLFPILSLQIERGEMISIIKGRTSADSNQIIV